MAALPVLTIDSFGNRSVPGLPPRVADPGTDATRQQLVRWVELNRRDPPGQWTDDRWQQARSFTNAVYVAVRTLMTGLSGASAVVLERRPTPVRKSQAASAAGAGESDWVPVGDGHEIARLFADPNDRDTFADFLAEYSLCRAVFGLGAVLWVPDRAGKPAELWNLRANYLTAAGGLTTEYPSGYWRYYMPQPMLWSTSAGSLTVPRERVVIHRHPHPLFPWDGYSPLTAGGKLVDFLNGVIDSRQMAMDRGLSLDAVIKVAGGSVDQIAQMKAQFESRFTGSNRGSRFAVVDGERVDIATLGNTPDKMSYKDSYDQGTSAVLALFGVPQSVAGLNESSSYSAFYAAARQFRETTLNAEAKAVGDVLTKHLIRPHWGDRFKVEIKLPPLLDPDLRERQNATLMQGNGITINELRASYDLPPMAGGDVTPKAFEAELARQAEPDPMAALTGGEGGGDEPPADPIAALLGGDPAAEPGAPGEVEPPAVGGAAAGSLPGAVAKSMDAEAYFAWLVSEVLA